MSLAATSLHVSGSWISEQLEYGRGPTVAHRPITLYLLGENHVIERCRLGLGGGSYLGQ